MKLSSLLLLGTSFCLLISFSNKPKPSAKSALKILKEFGNYVPGGYAIVDNDTVSVQGFYMSETEITNLQYAEFLSYLRKNGRTEDLKLAQVDSAKWVNKFGFGEPYKEYYHTHPAYHNYPVVNITKEGAELYCKWLTEMYDSISGGELSLQFRIPTRAEYLRASRGENHEQVYSWSGPYLRNSKGCILANFLAFGSENITKDPETEEYKIVRIPYPSSTIPQDADVLAPAKSYWPNDLGFYNLNGNASEMISDGDFVVGGDWQSTGYDIRNESIKTFEKPQPTVGFRIVASYISVLK